MKIRKSKAVLFFNLMKFVFRRHRISSIVIISLIICYTDMLSYNYGWCWWPHCCIYVIGSQYFLPQNFFNFILFSHIFRTLEVRSICFTNQFYWLTISLSRFHLFVERKRLTNMIFRRYRKINNTFLYIWTEEILKILTLIYMPHPCNYYWPPYVYSFSSKQRC